jgi:hypothetical protein
LGKTLIDADLSDPMSGFFVLKAGLLHGCVHNLSDVGLKILLDIFASSQHPLAFKEIPYVFRERKSGESKLDRRRSERRNRRLPVRGRILLGDLGVCRHPRRGGLELRRDRRLHLETPDSLRSDPRDTRSSTQFCCPELSILQRRGGQKNLPRVPAPYPESGCAGRRVNRLSQRPSGTSIASTSTSTSA